MGVCGHQDLGSTEGWVSARLREELDRIGPALTGLSNLAAGADQLFARLVVDRGADLVAVLPSRGYERTLSGDRRTEYAWLLGAAREVVVLDFPEPTEEAFFAAGRWVADHCDVLLAVWDGEPARGLGGTADIVGYAHTRGTEVRVLWPFDETRPV